MSRYSGMRPGHSVRPGKAGPWGKRCGCLDEIWKRHLDVNASAGAAVMNPDTGESAIVTTDGATLFLDAPDESAQLDVAFSGPAATCVSETTMTQTRNASRAQCMQIPNPFLCELCCVACIATHRKLGVPRWLDPLCCRYLTGCRCTS
jgi:hypothetical protein